MQEWVAQATQLDFRGRESEYTETEREVIIGEFRNVYTDISKAIQLETPNSNIEYVFIQLYMCVYNVPGYRMRYTPDAICASSIIINHHRQNESWLNGQFV